MSDFDWSNKETIVVRAVQAVAVYENGSGDVVIRQEGGTMDDEDSFVVVPSNQVGAIIAALQRLETK